MDITTKADIGDTLYFLSQNKVVTSTIQYINIDIEEGSTQFGAKLSTNIWYVVSTGQNFHESVIFLTKQELLDSL